MQRYMCGRAAAALCGTVLVLRPADGQEPDRPMIYSINPVGNGELVGAPESGSDFVRYDNLIWERVSQIGGRSARVLASWREVEAVKGRWDWSSLDRELELCRTYDVRPVVLIVNIPGWVSPTSRPAHDYPPKEEYAEDFKNFVTKLAERCRGTARHYEFWNEPNGYGWHVDFVDGRPRYNRADEYIPWLHRCYRAIKAVDGEAQVAIGGLDDAEGYAPIFVRMAYEMRRDRYGGEKFWDAIADHPYLKKAKEPIEAAVAKLDAIRKVAAEFGDRGIPLWITEYGWDVGHTTLAAQAHGTRAFLERLARPDQSDVVIAQQLCIADFEAVHRGFGLCDLNLRPRSAFYAFQKLARAPSPRLFGPLQYRVHAGGVVHISGMLEDWPSPRVQETVLEVHDERGALHAAALVKDARFSIVPKDLPKDTPLLAQLRLSDRSRRLSAPVARLPIIVPAGPGIANGGFESLFRAGIPWGWSPLGESICRDGGTMGPPRYRGGAHAAVLTQFADSSTRWFRFADRLEIPVAAGLGQRFTASCFVRYLSEQDAEAEITAEMELSEGYGRTFGAATPIGREWTPVAAELTAPCDAPILRLWVRSKLLPKGTTWQVAIDDVSLTPGPLPDVGE